MDEWGCNVCRHCIFNEEEKGFLCHNEGSPYFGWLLENVENEHFGCDGFDGHRFSDMTLKNALKTIAVPDMDGGFRAYYKLPSNGNGCAYAVFSFSSNKALEDFEDACGHLFIEYKGLARADGDFKREE